MYLMKTFSLKKKTTAVITEKKENTNRHKKFGALLPTTAGWLKKMEDINQNGRLNTY